MLQTSKFLVANIADPSARKILEIITTVAKNDTFNFSMNQNLFQTQIAQFAGVAAETS